MAKIKLEYLWLDGYEPIPNLRGKTKIVSGDPENFSLGDCPLWGFDGSSTQQAEGGDSDCMLKPVALYPDSSRRNGFLVMCEVMLPNGEPHPSNTRATIIDDPDAWFGFEQEYFLVQDGRPLGWPEHGFPEPQGEYYTGIGYRNIGDIARTIVEEHLDACLDAGINHEGINAEVAKGQWEFQVFGKGACTAADQIWVARYLLLRIGEKYGVDVDWHCKPFKGDWNGSGMHCNFSTKHLREAGGQDYFEKLMDQFKENMEEHIAAYGPENELRLTGMHETQAIDTFSYGVADRGASIRVPHSFVEGGKYQGYLEDRRPNSQADPYAVAARVLKTIAEVPTA
jgi:glutamine synthetase